LNSEGTAFKGGFDGGGDIFKVATTLDGSEACATLIDGGGRTGSEEEYGRGYGTDFDSLRGGSAGGGDLEGLRSGRSAGGNDEVELEGEAGQHFGGNTGNFNLNRSGRAGQTGAADTNALAYSGRAEAGEDEGAFGGRIHVELVDAVEAVAGAERKGSGRGGGEACAVGGAGRPGQSLAAAAVDAGEIQCEVERREKERRRGDCLRLDQESGGESRFVDSAGSGEARRVIFKRGTGKAGIGVADKNTAGRVDADRGGEVGARGSAVE
jgi:hypothetical protein